MDNQSNDTSVEMEKEKTFEQIMTPASRITQDGSLNIIRSVEAQLRMECLQLAIRGREGGDEKRIVEIAGKFEKFVKGEE